MFKLDSKKLERISAKPSARRWMEDGYLLGVCLDGAGVGGIDTGRARRNTDLVFHLEAPKQLPLFKTVQTQF